MSSFLSVTGEPITAGAGGRLALAIAHTRALIWEVIVWWRGEEDEEYSEAVSLR